MLIRILIALALAALPALPSLTLTLNPNVETGVPGGEVIFEGTFSVDSTDSYTFVNDVTATFTPPADAYLTLDANVFFNFTPGLLCGSLLNDPICSESYTGPIFGVIIDPLTPPGNYFGQVTLLGGADQSFFEPFEDPLTFEVHLGTIPEPAAVLLTGPALLAGLFALAKKRSR